MNDRYLFRGQTIDTKEWVYGYYAQVGHGLGQSGVSEEYGDVKNVIIVTKRKQSSLYSNAKPCEVTITEMVEVIPETVGLWTTLKDKNGKLVFEGDIIQTNVDKIIAIVRFGTITHKVDSKFKDEGFGLVDVDITGFYYEVSGENVFMRNELKTSDDCTIIGNVFEKEKSNFGYSLPERKA